MTNRLSSAAVDSTVPPVEIYEATVAALLGAQQAVAFGYARTALCAILSAAGLAPRDEIVLSPLTCKVVPLALLSLDLTPVYADVSAATLNLDAACVARALNSATRAILFQHTYGRTDGVEAVARLAGERRILFVEDCAQCLPIASGSRVPGSWGQASVFSNNLRKPLPAGSGGLAVTADNTLAQKMRTIRAGYPHRRPLAESRLRLEMWAHRHILRPSLYWPLFELTRACSPGYRARPLRVEIESEITSQDLQISRHQVSEGLRWLNKITDLAAHRRLCCAEYSHALEGLPGFGVEPATEPLYYFPILAANKPELLKRARRAGIELAAWPIQTPIYPIQRQRDLMTYRYQPGSCPVAEGVAAKLVGLPTHEQMTADKRRRLVTFLTRASQKL